MIKNEAITRRLQHQLDHHYPRLTRVINRIEWADSGTPVR
jgi:hypothetical protein